MGGSSMIGETISHYRILGKLGGGGMGVVYEAEDTRLGRRVALKFIPDNLVGDAKSLERFEREARAASQLNHPNICTIHDIEDNNGHPFIVMEKLEGESLKQMIHGKPLEVDEILDIGCPGRGCAGRIARQGHHSSRYQAREHLSDYQRASQGTGFGLAKLTKEAKLATSTDTGIEDSLTAVGVIPGTAVYMAPEQARSEPLDPRSDLFSFGVVLYEMSTGKKPFSGTNIVTTLDAVLHQKPAPPRSLNPAVPTELENIIGKAMEKDKAKRYQTAAEMKADLQHLKKETESGLADDRSEDGAASAGRLADLLEFRPAADLPDPRHGGLLVTVLGAVGAWWLKHRKPPAPTVAKNTIAVLPLQNMTGDGNMEYLRFALADEIASVLTYNRGLDVRPTASTRKYVERGSRSAASRTRFAGRQRGDRTLHEARRSSAGYAAGGQRGYRQCDLAEHADHRAEPGFHRTAGGTDETGAQRLTIGAGRRETNIWRPARAQEPGSLRSFPAQRGARPRRKAEQGSDRDAGAGGGVGARPTRPPGRLWECGITSTRNTRVEAKTPSRNRMRPLNELWHSIQI